MSETETNPEALEAEGVEAEAEATTEDQTEGLETEATEGDEPEAEPEEETEEVEWDGKKYALPKTLKAGLMMQADYTRKTQEVAEQRKALGARYAEIEQQAELQRATLTERVQLETLTGQLQQFQSLDWDQFESQYGASAVAKAMAQWRGLESKVGQLTSEITEKETAIRLQKDQAAEAALQEADKILSREVQGYGPALVQQVAQVAVAYGITPDEIKASFISDDGEPDIRTFKVLSELATLRAKVAEYESKQIKTDQVRKIAKVQPAPTVSPKGGQYRAGLDDSLPTDEWVRRRNAQVAKARAR